MPKKPPPLTEAQLRARGWEIAYEGAGDAVPPAAFKLDTTHTYFVQPLRTVDGRPSVRLWHRPVEERTHAPAEARRPAEAIPRDFRTPSLPLPAPYRRWLRRGSAPQNTHVPVVVTLWDGRQVEGYVEDGALGRVELEGALEGSVRLGDIIRVSGERRVVIAVDLDGRTGVWRVDSERCA